VFSLWKRLNTARCISFFCRRAEQTMGRVFKINLCMFALRTLIGLVTATRSECFLCSERQAGVFSWYGTTDLHYQRQTCCRVSLLRRIRYPERCAERPGTMRSHFDPPNESFRALGRWSHTGVAATFFLLWMK
jgi:hypothetical protein